MRTSAYGEEPRHVEASRVDRREPVEQRGAEEGHAVRFDANGRIIGITIVNARKLIDEQGLIRITLAGNDLGGRYRPRPSRKLTLRAERSTTHRAHSRARRRRV